MSPSFPPIEALVPHRAPTLYLDRVIAFEGGRLVAERTFQPDEFPGHFPGRPIVPGVVLIEGMAQALAALGGLGGERGQAVLTGVEKARFRGLVEPPATVTFEVEVRDRRFGLVLARGTARHGDRVVCTADLQAAMLPETTA